MEQHIIELIEDGLQVREPYQFDISEEWMQFLDENGYCVIRAVANEAEVTASKDLLWADMSRLFDIDREDPNSWGKLPNGSAGILSKELPQTRGAWLIRGLETVRSVFRAIWGTNNLLVSMDSVLLWLPWWKKPSWLPVSEGLHMDQNPFSKPTRCCVQGMVPLLDVTDESGGLEVVPFSHTPEALERFKRNHPQYNRPIASDWCVLRKPDEADIPAVLLKANSGDLILWDSRLIHGGRVGEKEAGISESMNVDLARLTVTVCMTPREFASEKVQRTRQKGFTTGNTYTHWPHEAVCTNLASKSFIPVELPPNVMELI